MMATTLKKTYDDVLNARADLIQRAGVDTQKWCVAPRTLVGKRHSDQYWMDSFSPGEIRNLDATMAHRFLVSFQLTNRVAWDKQQVADEISAFVSANHNCPVAAVTSLAASLRKSNGRRTQQTSAASKIAMFAKPALQVFIWDALAARSARARDWDRDGRRNAKPRNGVFSGLNGQHDYAAHHTACARALADELHQCDFKAAVADVESFLRGVGGPMMNRAVVPVDFIQRRLLDKLMFWEGWLMKKGGLPS